MRTKKVLLFLAVCALALAFFAGTATAQSDELRFKGSLNGECWWTPTGDPLHPLVTNSWAVGTAGPLGRITYAAWHYTPPMGVDDFGPGESTFTFLAQGGDKIFAHHRGNAHFVPGDHPSLLKGTGSFEIVGGTGRYAGATGAGTMRFHLQYPGPSGLEPGAPNWTAHWTFDGHITLADD